MAKSKRALVITPDHRYFVRGLEVPGNTAVLRAAGYGSGFGEEKHLERGRNVHLATRYFDEHRLDWTTLKPGLLPYVQGWAAFVRISGFTMFHVERPLYCRRWGFATRPDRIGVLDGTWGVLQIKTGSMDDSVGPQTAAEAKAGEEWLRRPLERFVVVLPGNGWFDFVQLTDRGDWPSFLAALGTWQTRRKYGWQERASRR